ncbi:hypothetical protein EDD86DRAFT_134288 [Gorgonomyces haynaldii]|nr:hypothetical protein EDD86DRAFT_134288 [Gorgonomyces haynaldii]
MPKQTHKKKRVPFGSKGFLVTCHRNRESNSFKEVKALISQHSEQVEFEGSIEEQIKQEMEHLNKKDIEMFDIVECQYFVETQMDPNVLGQKILSDIKSSGKKQTRYTQKLIPIVLTCHAVKDDIVKNTAELIESMLPKDATFCLVSKSRNNSSFNSLELKDWVMPLIKDRKVDYEHPDVTVVCNVVQLVCFIGFIRECNQKLSTLNLETLVSP